MNSGRIDENISKTFCSGAKIIRPRWIFLTQTFFFLLKEPALLASRLNVIQNLLLEHTSLNFFKKLIN